MSSAMLGAIEYLARALAVDMAPLRVNMVMPGFVHTEVFDRLPTEVREEAFREGANHILIPRPAQPSEPAEAYLCLMRGTYTTGQALIVDGGYTLV
jgi:NAD(P)-dependent dehydrogenase (short-subunit alcohol dehydrogenase family)